MRTLNRYLTKAVSGKLAFAALLAASQSVMAGGAVPSQLGSEATLQLLDEPTILNAPPSDAKRAYVLDPGAFHMTSQIFTIDGNNSKLLGMTDAGKLPHVLIGDGGKFMAVPSTLYSRIARGTREDYIEVFDTETHQVIADIDIPEARFLTAVMEHMATLSVDDKQLLFQQFSPMPAVGLVDLEQQAFVTMMPVPDCYHLFPVANQNFFMHCRDGSMLQVTYDMEGNTQQKSTKVFHPEDDYLFNNPAYHRGSGRLVWPSTNGKIFQANLTESGAEFLKPIEVFSSKEKAENWAPGGWQPVAYHANRDEIFLLADQRAKWTHKLPSRYVFVIDAATGKQLRRIELQHEITGINVSQDAEPYLFAVSADDATLYTFDAVTGQELNSIDELGRAPSMVFLPRE